MPVLPRTAVQEMVTVPWASVQVVGQAGVRPLQWTDVTGTALAAAAAVTMLGAFSPGPCRAPRTRPPATPMPTTMAARQAETTCLGRGRRGCAVTDLEPSVEVAGVQ